MCQSSEPLKGHLSKTYVFFFWMSRDEISRAGRGEAGKEPAEFLPPAEDVAFVDARGLTLQQINEEEVRCSHALDVFVCCEADEWVNCMAIFEWARAGAHGSTDTTLRRPAFYTCILLASRADGPRQGLRMSYRLPPQSAPQMYRHFHDLCGTRTRLNVRCAFIAIDSATVQCCTAHTRSACMPKQAVGV